MQNAPNPMSLTALSALVEHLRAAGYRFVTPTPATHHRVNNRPGNERALLANGHIRLEQTVCSLCITGLPCLKS